MVLLDVTNGRVLLELDGRIGEVSLQSDRSVVAKTGDVDVAGTQVEVQGIELQVAVDRLLSGDVVELAAPHELRRDDAVVAPARAGARHVTAGARAEDPGPHVRAS